MWASNGVSKIVEERGQLPTSGVCENHQADFEAYSKS